MKTFIAILVIIVLALGGWWIYKAHEGTVAVAPSTTTTQSNVPGNAGQTSTASASDTSDASVDSNLSTIDTQMNGLNSDGSSADAGISNPNQ